jgi:hypothetical protein
VTSEQLVLDTDIASRWLRGALAARVESRLRAAETIITFVTVGELYRGADHARWGPRRRAELADWIDDHQVIAAGRAIARRWGLMTGGLLRTGRPLPVNDSWIAACCLHHDLPLATHSTADFADIPGLRLIPVS